MNISSVGLKLIKELEGFRAQAYQDSRGVWTVGYGHTGPDVRGSTVKTEGEAVMDLERDVQVALDCLAGIGCENELTQGQVDALVSFIFNVGCLAFSRSQVRLMLHEGKTALALIELFRWVHVHGTPNDGLLNRRLAEARMYVS